MVIEDSSLPPRIYKFMSGVGDDNVSQAWRVYYLMVLSQPAKSRSRPNRYPPGGAYLLQGLFTPVDTKMERT